MSGVGCGHCGGPMPERRRADQTYCSGRCRTAACRERATTTPERSEAGRAVTGHFVGVTELVGSPSHVAQEGLTAAELYATPRRSDRVRAIWAAMSPAARERASAGLSPEQRAEAVAVLLDASEVAP